MCYMNRHKKVGRWHACLTSLGAPISVYTFIKFM